ncbi:MAG: hypothetical protein RJB26_1904 [Pseudomonadota bacterium]|jgi:uncharacterized protein YigA (DUF484 family)
MSTAPASPLAALTEADVAAFLKDDVDFFTRHEALLAQLRLPHARGGSAVSLVERQVDALREQKREADAKLRDFIAVARDNTALQEHIHRLACALITARSLEAVVTALERSLREDFQVRDFTLVLLQKPVPALGSSRLRFATAAETAACGLDAVLAQATPRCGNLRDSQREWLFPAHPGAIASAAVVPLGGGKAGLLALASPDAARYHPGMSTDFLTRVAELVSAALDTVGSGPTAV